MAVAAAGRTPLAVVSTRQSVVASHALLAVPGGCSAISAAIVAIVWLSA